MVLGLVCGAVRAMSNKAYTMGEVIAKMRPLAVSSDAFEYLYKNGIIKHVANAVCTKQQDGQIYTVCQYDKHYFRAVEVGVGMMKYLMTPSNGNVQGFFEIHKTRGFNENSGVIVVGQNDKVRMMSRDEVSAILNLEKNFGRVHVSKKSLGELEEFVPLVCCDKETSEYIVSCIGDID